MTEGLSFIVDRREENLVVLVNREGEEIILPLSLFPDLRPGEAVKLYLETDKETTEKRKKLIADLQKDNLNRKRHPRKK